MLTQWSDQSCEYYGIEGGSEYNGYDYYTNQISTLYSAGVPIYFQYFDTPNYGMCIQYIATLPPSESQNFTYFLTYQNSTGYLLEYKISGTELCCGIANYSGCACPNGVVAPSVYVYANSSVFYSNYYILSENDWPNGFFGEYCPTGFSNFYASAPTFAPFSSLSSSDSTSSNGLSVSESIAIASGVLFFLSFLLNVCLIYGIKSNRFSKNQSYHSPLDDLLLSQEKS